MPPPAPPDGSVPLSSMSIPNRPRDSSLLQTTLFALWFVAPVILIHFTQFLVMPLKFFPPTEALHRSLIRRSKGAFGKILVSITQLFGPSRLVVSFKDEKGNLIPSDQFVQYGPDGETIENINLPKRSIWISNHQVYSDWIYLWILAYKCGFDQNIIIVLKDTLKWIPIIGYSMQWFEFIFLARNWSKDQRTLTHHLQRMARLSHLDSNPLMLLLYPEGTLVSKDTRPISKKYADKAEVEDCRNLLLPRSTGMLYCARTLKRQVEDLKVIDVTIGYPGVPPAGYGQSYYTLRSIYMQGVPPPHVHISITIRGVTAGPSSPSSIEDGTAAPIGELPPLDKASAKTLDASEHDRQIFDQWLLKRWREKDDLLDEFYKNGDFVKGKFSGARNLAGEYYRENKGQLEQTRNEDAPGAQPGAGAALAEKQDYFTIVPIGIKNLSDWLDLFAWGIPIWVGLLVWKVSSLLT